MLSKLVADREASDRAVAAAFETHGGLAAERAAARLAPYLAPGEVMPDLKLLVALFGRLLGAASAAMTAADQAHTLELGDDAPVRHARDAASAAVTNLVTNIRLALTSRFGEDFGGNLGAVGPAPKAPNDVLSWGGKVLAAVRALDVSALDPSANDNDEVVAFAQADAVAKLARRLDALKHAMTGLATEDREAEATLTGKDAAIARHDEDFAFTARVLEALLELAGERELAARVRPSTRRPGTTAAPGDARAPQPTPEPVP